MTNMTIVGNEKAKSAPEIIEEVSFGSFQAQKVMKRSFDKLNEALFSIGVRLQVICEQEEMDSVEEIVNGYFQAAMKSVSEEKDRLSKMLEDNGIAITPDYSNVITYKVSIMSPQAAMFLGMVKELESLVSMIDTLWLNSIFTSRQRKDATYQYQQTMIRLAGKVIGTEKRVRMAAYKKNGDQEEAKKAEKELAEHEAENAKAEAEDAKAEGAEAKAKTKPKKAA